MAPSEKAAASGGAEGRAAGGGRARGGASRSPGGRDVGGDARTGEGRTERRPEEDGSRRQAGPRPRASRVGCRKGSGAWPLPTSCRGRRTGEERRGRALVICARRGPRVLLSRHHQRMRMRSILPSALHPRPLRDALELQRLVPVGSRGPAAALASSPLRALGTQLVEGGESRLRARGERLVARAPLTAISAHRGLDVAPRRRRRLVLLLGRGATRAPLGSPSPADAAAPSAPPPPPPPPPLSAGRTSCCQTASAVSTSSAPR